MKKGKLKIAIIGYGAMGRQIEKIAQNRGLVVTDIFEIDSRIDKNKEYDFDVAIDFSIADSVIENVSALSKLKKNIVIGTTGWDKDFKKVSSLVVKSDIGVVYGSNFSMGMQMFYRIAELAAKLKNHQPEYDIFMHEIHHKRKKDSPSGTALALAKIIQDNVPQKKKIITDKCSSAIDSSELHVSSTRGGEIAGTHTIYLDSESDTIELTHRAKNRTGFALGAVRAAEWISGKRGFYNISDVVDDIWRI